MWSFNISSWKDILLLKTKELYIFNRKKKFEGLGWHPEYRNIQILPLKSSCCWRCVFTLVLCGTWEVKTNTRDYSRDSVTLCVSRVISVVITGSRPLTKWSSTAASPDQKNECCTVTCSHRYSRYSRYRPEMGPGGLLHVSHGPDGII